MSRLGTVPLDRCIESIRAGVSLSGEARRPRGDEIGILTLGAVSGGELQPDACKALPSDRARSLGGHVRAGTLLMSRSNTAELVGSVVLVEQDHADRFLPDLLWEIRLRGDSPVTPAFLTDFLQSDEGRRLLQAAAMGTSGSMKKLSMGRVRAIEVPVVNREVQEAWTTVRSSLRKALAAIERLLTTKRAFKRALLHELLTGRRRFPQFGNDVVHARLGDVLVINPETLAASTDPSYAFRYIDLSSIQQGRQVVAPRSLRFGEAPSRARRQVRQHDVLFATVRPNLQGHGFVEEPESDLVCSTGFAVLRAGTAGDARYVFEVVFSDDVQRQIGARLVGSSFPALSADDVASIQIPWPCEAERSAIGKLLSMTSREIAALDRLHGAYEAQKRGLMHRLLSGDLPLLASIAAPELAHA